MERFSSRPQGPVHPGAHPRAPQRGPEDFSEMVEVTARRPGIFGKLLVLSLIIVSVAVTAFVGYAIVNNVGTSNSIDSDKYQAVFLSDGQIYFGKLTNTDRQYTVLEDIFYLQVKNDSSVQQAGTEAPQSIQLVKLGNEIHGPMDKMFLNTDQILFWENLKDDGKVATAIATYKTTGPDATDQTTTPATTTPATTTPVDETAADTTTENQ